MTTILVADDSAVQRQLIAGLLAENGFSVVTATNGAEAIAKIGKAAPDAVILDIVMPEMNGYEACRHLKNNPKTQHIPVILCSTKGMAADIYWGQKIGADAYLVKPFSPEELMATLRRVSQVLQPAD